MNYSALREWRTKNFRVVLDYADDPEPDSSFDETGETAEKLASGEWGCFVFRVTVYDSDGRELGQDHLGQSIHADPAEFIDHRACGRQNREYAAQGQSGRCGSYLTDMIAEAISEARKSYNKPRAFLRAV